MIRLVRVVTVAAFHVFGNQTAGEVLGRIMHPDVVLHRMAVWFGQGRCQIGCGDGAVVTYKAVVFFIGEKQQSFSAPCLVGCMAVFTAVFAHGGEICIGPESIGPVEYGRRSGMGG